MGLQPARDLGRTWAAHGDETDRTERVSSRTAHDGVPGGGD